MLVPVLSKEYQPLMPCSPKRAKHLMNKGDAQPYWRKGIFCIRLLRKSEENLQKVVLGIDPGSKREGYTICTEKKVVLNITSNTSDWVKSNIETRRNLRRSRRQRKTPYRKCRSNRSCLKNPGLPPSTKARWDNKLRIIKVLQKILPLRVVNIEDICAKSKEGQKKWNKSFSPLEVGKVYFANEVGKLNLQLIKTPGYETSKIRKLNSYFKSKDKLSYLWDAHNVDSHVLCEIILNKKIKPDYKVYCLEFMRWHRRQLHVQKLSKNGFRRRFGSTVSNKIPRGTIVKYIGNNKKYKNKLCYIEGYLNDKITTYLLFFNKRKLTKISDIKILYFGKWRIFIKENNE